MVADPSAFSDASSGTGIGIVIGSRWRAWRLLPGSNQDRRDIGWAESVGFEFLIRTLLADKNHPSHIKVYGDNKGVVEGWWKHCSRNPPVNGVFRRVHDLLDDEKTTIYSRYVSTHHNPADEPSGGGSTGPDRSFCHLLKYRHRSSHSSSTSTHPYPTQQERLRRLHLISPHQNPSIASSGIGDTSSNRRPPALVTNSSPTSSSGGIRGWRFSHIALSFRPSSVALPQPYKAHLTPRLSPLRPHCFARERLLVWRPEHSRLPADQFGRPLPLSSEVMVRLQSVLVHAWSDSSYETYGSGIYSTM